MIASRMAVEGWLVIPLVFDTAGVLWRNETHAEAWRPFWTQVFRCLFLNSEHWALFLDYTRSKGSTVAVSRVDAVEWPWPECQETYCRPLVLLAAEAESPLSRCLSRVVADGWPAESGIETLHEPMYDRVSELVPEDAVGYLGGYGEEFAFGFLVSGNPVPSEEDLVSALSTAAPSEAILNVSSELVQQIENQDFLSLHGYTGRILFG